VQSTAPVLAPTVINAFANESHNIKLSDEINQDKKATLEAIIRAIKMVDLYDLV
jgi:hypothetical protein